MSAAWSVGGLLTAGLGLIALETILSAQNNPASGASNLPGLLMLPGQLAAAWMDPAVPLIPDRSQSSALSAGGALGGSLGGITSTGKSSKRSPASSAASTVGAGAQLGAATITNPG